MAAQRRRSPPFDGDATIVLDCQREVIGTKLTVRVRGGSPARMRVAFLATFAALAAACIWWPPGLPAAAATLLLAVAAAAVSWELSEVTSESVLVLPGGVGYVLESVRRCGLRRRRFLDAREVSYVALSEAVTSCDVRFFLSFVPRDDARGSGAGAGAGTGVSSNSSSGGGGGRHRLAVPFENLLPRLRLRHLTAIYRELVPPPASASAVEEEEKPPAGSCRMLRIAGASGGSG
ncbi:hypothetical protein PLESTB_001265000 [Pleodorina starrii]|uniref:GPI-GlcNAc transferase complex PIG-H component conserved domain-containing protein n=1 Tax=Pleodorina starrii TaxID=330485 RepID=A0A9W6BUK8_9CHLO|nr:hypothetical protein PLESTM_000714000 [Pleodorina starrii]GLC57771.1 hypothetical protein PLESTB_001265000 [Pleodorina starrii]